MIRFNDFLTFGGNNIQFALQMFDDGWSMLFRTSFLWTGNEYCWCGSWNLCLKSQGFYNRVVTGNQINTMPNRTIPGLVFGCLPMDTLLWSTLECFYNQTCIDMVLDWRLFDCKDICMPLILSNITALQMDVNNRFLPNDTIITLIRELFVEQWTMISRFDFYFKQCAPQSCTYTFIKRYEFIHILTMIFGLLGGLQVIFRIISPAIVKVVLYIYNHCCRRNPETGSNSKLFLL